MTDRCEIPGCRADAELTYLGHGICTAHWNEFTAEALRMVLGIEADASAKENDMRKKTMPPRKTENAALLAAAKAPETATPTTATEPPTDAPTAEQGAPVAAPDAEAEPAVEATPAPKKKTREKKTAAPKVETPAPPKTPKEPLVVFAFRLTQTERDAIHATAGPRNATQFVRRVAVAFAGEDEAAFQSVLNEAREARQ